MSKLKVNLQGCCAYNNLTKNFRNNYRSNNTNELSIDWKRRFSLSARSDASERRGYTLKSILEFDTRKKLWDDFKSQCNEKLVILGEILTNQCNFIASQRVRRMSQMWNLYNQLYSEKTIKTIVSQWSKNLRSKTRPFSLMLGTALFSWESEKITDEEIKNFSFRYGRPKKLQSTLSQEEDRIRKVDESLLEEMFFSRNCNLDCMCELEGYRSSEDHPTKPISGQGLVNKLLEDGWEAVIKKECVQVWRKAFPNSYLYQYKIMGTFYDVPARTFFAVQTDIEYRKKWDKLVIKLDVIDKEGVDGGCEVMHWVMHYPYPMYSREYVYIRRAVISPETNTMVLVSRAIDHPSCPVNNKYVRVHDYSSRMVIRPHGTYDENGFDYVLTYFDDPQAAFPAPAYNWMARSGVPDFVEKLHAAAKELHCQEMKNKPCLPTIMPNKDTCPTNTNNFDYVYM